MRKIHPADTNENKKEMQENLSVYSIAIALVVLPASSSRNESCWFAKFCVYRRKQKWTK